MSNFFTRLFGGSNNIIKDPQLGKLRFLESSNGNVWSGIVQLDEKSNQVDFYIESDEKILKHENRNILINILEDMDSVLLQVNQHSGISLFSKNDNQLLLSIIHIPKLNGSYEAELIFAHADQHVSILWKDGNIVDVVPHDENDR